jgi:tetraacyldisaccharide 4'-kinase
MKPARPLLAPLAPLYRLAVDFRELRLAKGWEPVRRLARPVVSIGNLSVGGAGKTPLAIALARAITRRGVAVDVLSRGYGRSSTQAARVDPEGTAAEFGDEPLLITRAIGLPVYVARQRYLAGQMAEAEEFQKTIHLLDDGFQHRQLHRDIDIVLVSKADLDDCLLPWGNLREPLQALRRASILAVPADEPATETRLRAMGFTGPLWRIRRRMDIPSIDGPVVAFCGIARPAQFFSGVEQAGLRIAGRKAFADHHRYALADLLALAKMASAAGAVLITTEKDAARIGTLRRQMPVPLLAAGLRSEIEDEDAAIDWLLNRLQ